MQADQGPSAAVTTPAVDVKLLPSQDAITAVLSQSADGAVCCDAAVYDCQMQEVELGLRDAAIAVLSCPGEYFLCIFDVWPEDGDIATSVQICCRA